MQLASATESVHPAHSLYERMRLYNNPVLLNKLQTEHALTAEQAELLFEDVKRFLALAVTSTFLLAPTRELDRGWHTFILFTQDYAVFCNNYCGRFVHHVPEDPFAEIKDRTSIPRTRDLARLVFGVLSSNWEAKIPANADCCPPSCQGKDCSPTDCTSCKTCSDS